MKSTSSWVCVCWGEDEARRGYVCVQQSESKFCTFLLASHACSLARSHALFSVSNVWAAPTWPKKRNTDLQLRFISPFGMIHLLFFSTPSPSHTHFTMPPQSPRNFIIAAITVSLSIFSFHVVVRNNAQSTDAGANEETKTTRKM